MGGISRYFRYIRKFGVSAGTSLYSQSKRPLGQTFALDVRGMSHPIHLRPGTSDRRSFDQVFVDGEYEMRSPCPPGLIIDAGANVGCGSVFFASRYPDAMIFAVEPEADNYEMLCRNVAPYPNVTPVLSAVWSSNGRLAIDHREGGSWAFRVREAREGEADAFSAVTIAELFERSGKPTIDILKLDVEGAEYELFSDEKCHSWLQHTNMIFIELHDRFRPGCSAVLNQAISKHPFRRSQAGEKVIFFREVPLG
jgi:FkbM family methyltransferase